VRKYLAPFQLHTCTFGFYLRALKGSRKNLNYKCFPLKVHSQQKYCKCFARVDPKVNVQTQMVAVDAHYFWAVHLMQLRRVKIGFFRLFCFKFKYFNFGEKFARRLVVKANQC